MNETAPSALRQKREALGRKLSEVARKIGISKPSLSSIERGLQRPSLKTVEALAAELGMAPEEIDPKLVQDLARLSDLVRHSEPAQ
jgi:transcriptional regulator with XRE-family HTH domain